MAELGIFVGESGTDGGHSTCRLATPAFHGQSQEPGDLMAFYAQNGFERIPGLERMFAPLSQSGN